MIRNADRSACLHDGVSDASVERGDLRPQQDIAHIAKRRADLVRIVGIEHAGISKRRDPVQRPGDGNSRFQRQQAHRLHGRLDGAALEIDLAVVGPDAPEQAERGPHVFMASRHAVQKQRRIRHRPGDMVAHRDGQCVVSGNGDKIEKDIRQQHRRHAATRDPDIELMPPLRLRLAP